MYVHSRIWLAIIGGIMAVLFNSYSISAVGEHDMFLISSFLTGFLIVYSAIIINDFAPAPHVFRPGFWRLRKLEKQNSGVNTGPSKSNNKKPHGERNK